MRQPAAAGELCLGWEGQVTPGLRATLRIFPLCSLAPCEDQLTFLLRLRRIIKHHEISKFLVLLTAWLEIAHHKPNPAGQAVCIGDLVQNTFNTPICFLSLVSSHKVYVNISPESMHANRCTLVSTALEAEKRERD